MNDICCSGGEHGCHDILSFLSCISTFFSHLCTVNINYFCLLIFGSLGRPTPSSISAVPSSSFPSHLFSLTLAIAATVAPLPVANDVAAIVEIVVF